LPVDTKEARRQYALFRKELLKDGFARMQFSVYIRHCASEENAAVHGGGGAGVAAGWEVRVMLITDKQFERMRVFWGKMRKPVERHRSSWRCFEGAGGVARGLRAEKGRAEARTGAGRGGGKRVAVGS